jgi:serine/threonine protein kinase
MSTFGRYELIERIGQGGMAEVWKAALSGPRGFARTLALKRILPARAGDADLTALFLREAQVMARLNHRGIVQVFELGEVEGRPFLVMEYLEGITLFELIRGLPAERDLELGLVVFIVRELCHALAYLHRVRGEDGEPLGIVHRDVTPQNVMLTVNGGVKLLDFGIARPFEDFAAELTRVGTARGKVGYMAREQLDRADVDHRADLYALGVVLYELITARRLFPDRGDLAELCAQRTRPIDPPSALRPGVPPGLDAVCQRALFADRNGRYKDAGEMAAALEPFVDRGTRGGEQLTAVVRERLRRHAPSASPPTTRLIRGWQLVGALGLGIAIVLALVWRRAPIAAPRPTASVQSPKLAETPPVAETPSIAPTRSAPTRPELPEHQRKAASVPADRRVRDVRHGQLVDPFPPAGR